ncbi:MAG TPA: redoxin domain-containing protein, partial [Blastocatellia bacterium]|nr:redoxin domain-containing protein [Blastocatellia bacterium]
MKYLLLTALLLSSLPLNAQKALKGEIEHKLVTFQKHRLDYKNFVLPTPVAGQSVNLREQAKGKKLILITYFAAWCENSNHDYETIKDLLKKFGDKGLGVVGVCNYSELKEVKDFIIEHQPSYPIAIESKDDKQREKTTHYSYRKLCGDDRKWGTPFTLLIEAKNIQPDGELLTDEVWAANGELDK